MHTPSNWTVAVHEKCWGSDLEHQVSTSRWKARQLCRLALGALCCALSMGASCRPHDGDLPRAESSPPRVSPPGKASAAEDRRAVVVRRGFPAIISRSEWGALPAQAALLRPHQIRLLTLHHTAGRLGKAADARRQMRSIQRFHQRSRGWGDIAYHYLIAPSGTIFEGRASAYQPDTATDYDTKGHLGICLMGNFEEQPPTPEALLSLKHLAAYLLDAYRLPESALGQHRDFAATACPGRLLTDWFQEEGRKSILKATHERSSTR